MSCANKKANLERCTCSYPGCPRKGICCECIQYHLKNDEVPGCFFPREAERTYDRSREYFVSVCRPKR
ncbi:MAG: hypothetical protein JXD21_08310 [Candidatus Omnitrophica bacterium]|nr:hypothetical protein [Candidatus Omnitrophota bacterium]